MTTKYEFIYDFLHLTILDLENLVRVAHPTKT